MERDRSLTTVWCTRKALHPRVGRFVLEGRWVARKVTHNSLYSTCTKMSQSKYARRASRTNGWRAISLLKNNSDELRAGLVGGNLLFIYFLSLIFQPDLRISIPNRRLPRMKREKSPSSIAIQRNMSQNTLTCSTQDRRHLSRNLAASNGEEWEICIDRPDPACKALPVWQLRQRRRGPLNFFVTKLCKILRVKLFNHSSSLYRQVGNGH